MCTYVDTFDHLYTMYTVTDLALWYKDFQAHLPTHNSLPKKKHMRASAAPNESRGLLIPKRWRFRIHP